MALISRPELGSKAGSLRKKEQASREVQGASDATRYTGVAVSVVSGSSGWASHTQGPTFPIWHRPRQSRLNRRYCSQSGHGSIGEPMDAVAAACLARLRPGSIREEMIPVAHLLFLLSVSWLRIAPRPDAPALKRKSTCAGGDPSPWPLVLTLQPSPLMNLLPPTTTRSLYQPSLSPPPPVSLSLLLSSRRL